MSNTEGVPHPQTVDAANTSTVRPRTSTFRGDIEGLRAIAVIGVVLFHAHFPHFGGGFVGVDVFYVLSGFLITGLIVNEIEKTGRLSLSQFWGRRMRRLLPAAALVLVVTVCGSYVALDPLSLGQAAHDAAAAAGYIANWWFAHQAVDYLAADNPPSPVLHYWSLSVEEQFYVIWPLLFAGVTAFATRRRVLPFLRRQLGAVVLIVGTLSFLWSWWLTYRSQPYAFFSTPSRAWQLAIGAGIALSIPFWQRQTTAIRLSLGLGGLAAVAFAFISLSDASGATAYPGLIALIPTLGAAAVVASGVSGGKPTIVHRSLSVRPLRFIGRLSYSWYLWHWPVLILAEAYIGHTISLTQRVVCAVIALALAWVTYRFVEDPIRRAAPLARSAWKSITVGAAASVAVIITSFVVPSFAGQTGEVAQPPAGGVTLPNPLVSSTVPAGTYVIGPRQARADKPIIYDNGCQALAFAGPEQLPCEFGDLSATKTVLLFGDSHAAQWFPALDAAAKKQHYKLLSWTRSGCPWFPIDLLNMRTKTAYPACRTWQKMIATRIANNPPDVVVLASIEHDYRVRGSGGWMSIEQSQPTVTAEIAKTLPTFVKSGAHIVVMHDTPHMSVDVPRCVARNLYHPEKCAMPRDKGFAFGGIDAATAAKVSGVSVLDLTPALCGPAPQPCDVVRQGMVLYRDSNHITATYSRLLAPNFYPLLP